MIEPDYTYQTMLSLSLEDATQNLSQNLHLKWNYGLLYIDKYSDERGLPISIVSGLFKHGESTLYHVRVELVSQQKSVNCNVSIWRVMMTGWPMPAGLANLTSSSKDSDVVIDLLDNIVEFCTTPYEQSSGVFSWLSNFFSDNLEKRKYQKRN